MAHLIFYILSAIVALVIYICYETIPTLLRIWRSRIALQPFCYIKPHWLFGHLKIYPGPNEKGLWQINKWLESYPRLFTFHFGPLRPTLFLAHPETVKLLLKTAEPKPLQFGGSYKLLLPWIGDGLLLSGGEKWFRNRRLLTPAFHFDILKPYIGVYNHCINTLMNVIEERSANGKSVEIFQPVSLCTLDIILRCAFSYQKEIQQQTSEPYVDTVYSLLKLIVKRAFMPLMYLDKLYFRTADGKEFLKQCDMSHNKAMEIIQNRKQELRKEKVNVQENRYVDFLDILLLAKDDNGEGLTDLEIRNEVETFMFEGHDTTSSGISWVWYNMAKHPDIQQKAREEIKSILSGRSPSELTWDDMSKFNYVTMCIKESLRMYPPVPFISRTNSKPMEIDGHIIPPGTLIDVSIWGLHHNKSVWGPDHMMYKPERFLPENIKNMDSYAFTPFSAGPRNCIGQHFAMDEMKTTLVHVLSKFQLSVDESHHLELSPEVILKSTDGIKLFFHKIEN